MTFEIRKTDHSSRPWRLFRGDQPMTHMQVVETHDPAGPGLKQQVVEMPFCADTKRELVEMILQRLAQLNDEVARLRGLCGDPERMPWKALIEEILGGPGDVSWATERVREMKAELAEERERA